MSPQPFPLLPSELAHYILLKTAQLSPGSAKNVSLVASWARSIALPHILPVCIVTHEPVAPLARNFGTSPFDYTKSIYFVEREDSHSSHSIDTYLSQFPNANRLALTAGSFTNLTRRVTCFSTKDDWDITILFPDQTYAEGYHGALAFTTSLPALPAYLHLTRLRIGCKYYDWDDEFQIELSRFENLTHLAVGLLSSNFAWVADLVERMLAPKRLKMAVLLTEEEHHQAGWFMDEPARLLDDLVKKTQSHDSRFYVLPGEGLSELERTRKEWLEESHGGESIWEKAVRFADKENGPR